MDADYSDTNTVIRVLIRSTEKIIACTSSVCFLPETLLFARDRYGVRLPSWAPHWTCGTPFMHEYQRRERKTGRTNHEAHHFGLITVQHCASSTNCVFRSLCYADFAKVPLSRSRWLHESLRTSFQCFLLVQCPPFPQIQQSIYPSSASQQQAICRCANRTLRHWALPPSLKCSCKTQSHLRSLQYG